MLSLLQRPAVLWSLVALVSVPQQAATAVVSTMVRGGSTSPRGWKPLQGCLVGLQGGTGTSTSGESGTGRGPQPVPCPGPASL